MGHGLLESAYQECLYFELKEIGLNVDKQKALPLVYKEVKLDVGYRLDLMVKNKVIVELKSVETLSEVHLAQTITYLKLTNCELGLLINFNVVRLVDGLKRVVNNF